MQHLAIKVIDDIVRCGNVDHGAVHRSYCQRANRIRKPGNIQRDTKPLGQTSLHPAAQIVCRSAVHSIDPCVIPRPALNQSRQHSMISACCTVQSSGTRYQMNRDRLTQRQLTAIDRPCCDKKISCLAILRRPQSFLPISNLITSFSPASSARIRLYCESSTSSSFTCWRSKASISRIELPRALKWLQLLSEWSHEQVEQVFT